MDRPIFDIMPVTNSNEAMLIWEQQDNYRGLQAVRGYNGQPPKVQPTGANQYTMEPGVYGEFIPISELEIIRRRQYGTFGTGIDLTDLVMVKQDQLLDRRLSRIEYIGWTLLCTGTFSIPGPQGTVIHTDSFPITTYTAPVPWATSATAAPLADLSAVQLLSRGHSVNFGSAATMYMNRYTFNNLRTNTNAADIYGRRTAGLGTYNNLQSINELFMGDDLPQIVVYDGGYLNDSGVFIPFIPNNVALVIGKRPGNQVIAEYRMTRNANNPDLSAGPYMRVFDAGEMTVPRNIEVHDGHNGGPIIYFPAALCILNV